MSFWHSLLGLSFHERCKEHLDVLKEKLLFLTPISYLGSICSRLRESGFILLRKNVGTLNGLEIEPFSYLSLKFYNTQCYIKRGSNGVQNVC